MTIDNKDKDKELLTWNTHILRTPDGVPFYVGKSRHSRCPSHYASHAASSRGMNIERETIIQVLWKEGKDFICDIMFTSESEAACMEYQKELIKEIGRDRLCNNTDGGKGVTNYTNQHGARKLSAKEKFLLKSKEESSE